MSKKEDSDKPKLFPEESYVTPQPINSETQTYLSPQPINPQTQMQPLLFNTLLSASKSK